MKRALAVLMTGLLLVGCGKPSSTRPSPSPPSTPSVTATTTPSSRPTPGPTAAVLRPGAPAYISVTVATLWRNPSVVRAIDAPALANPVRLRDWISGMTWSQKADLIGRADSQVLLGDRIIVVSLAGGWAQVVVPDQATPLDTRGYPGWLPTAQLSAIAPPATATVAAVTSPGAWLHKANGATLEASFGTRLPVLAEQGGSLKVGLPAGETATILQADVINSSAGTLPGTAASVIASAESFRGLQYLWAGTSGFGYDCSGLVYAVYAMHGLRLPRDADAQASAGNWVARGSLQPGDLVFFGSASSTVHHVAIFVGDGNILESPQTGYPVRVIPLSTYSDYFTGRRVLS